MINKTNEQLVKEIQAGSSAVNNLEQLYQNNLGFIRKIAAKYAGYAEIEDLMQEAYFGLYEAVQRFESGHNVLFMTYAAYWIEQTIRRYVMRCCHLVRVSEYTAGQVLKYKKYVEAYQQYYGELPSRDEIRAYLYIDEESLKCIEKVALMRQIKSLDEPLKDSDDMSLADTVTSENCFEDNIVNKECHRQLKKELWTMVDSLEGQQPDVIRRRYQENMTLQALADMMGVSIGGVRQVENRALRTLRLPKNAKRLRPYLTEKQEVSAFHGSSVQSFNVTWTSSTERAALL